MYTMWPHQTVVCIQYVRLLCLWVHFFPVCIQIICLWASVWQRVFHLCVCFSANLIQCEWNMDTLFCGWQKVVSIIIPPSLHFCMSPEKLVKFKLNHASSLFLTSKKMSYSLSNLKCKIRDNTRSSLVFGFLWLTGCQSRDLSNHSDKYHRLVLTCSLQNQCGYTKISNLGPQNKRMHEWAC